MVFRGASEQKGGFEGIAVEASVRGESKIEHARVLFGGANDVPPLSVGAPITISDVEVRDSARAMEINVPTLRTRR